MIYTKGTSRVLHYHYEIGGAVLSETDSVRDLMLDRSRLWHAHFKNKFKDTNYRKFKFSMEKY